MALLPPNLAICLLDDSLPWEHATQFHISEFLELYTLHDSYWVGILGDCAYEDSAIAVIRLDPVWNSSVSQPTSICNDWPVLFLRFKCVGSIQFSGYKDIGEVQRGIADVCLRRDSEEEITSEITDHYGGMVSIRHFPLIDALAISPRPEGKVLKLSNRAERRSSEG